MQPKNLNDLRTKDLFLFDMDGTIYLGGKPFPEAVHFIKELRKNGKRVLFFTNNASHNHEFYIEKLNRLGFEATESELMSSADVTIGFINSKRNGKKVYLIGTPELYREMKAGGVSLICDENGKVTDDEKADIVISSFDTTVTYEKLVTGCDYIRDGAEYLCTHPDFNCPTETGFVPDSGAIAALITASTGVSPRYFGKPYADTVDMICELTNTEKEKMCIIGDRLYTDIATGKKHGITAVLVMTGETTEETLREASEDEQPDLIYDNLADAENDVFGGRL